MATNFVHVAGAKTLAAIYYCNGRISRLEYAIAARGLTGFQFWTSDTNPISCL